MIKRMIFFVVALLSIQAKALPVVDFIEKPSANTAEIMEGQTRYFEYAIYNNLSAHDFPLLIESDNSAFKRVTNTNNDCGDILPAKASCHFTYALNVPLQSEMPEENITASIRIDFANPRYHLEDHLNIQVIAIEDVLAFADMPELPLSVKSDSKTEFSFTVSNLTNMTTSLAIDVDNEKFSINTNNIRGCNHELAAHSSCVIDAVYTADITEIASSDIGKFIISNGMNRFARSASIAIDIAPAVPANVVFKAADKSHQSVEKDSLILSYQLENLGELADELLDINLPEGITILDNQCASLSAGATCSLSLKTTQPFRMVAGEMQLNFSSGKTLIQKLSLEHLEHLISFKKRPSYPVRTAPGTASYFTYVLQNNSHYENLLADIELPYFLELTSNQCEQILSPQETCQFTAILKPGIEIERYTGAININYHGQQSQLLDNDIDIEKLDTGLDIAVAVSKHFVLLGEQSVIKVSVNNQSTNTVRPQIAIPDYADKIVLNREGCQASLAAGERCYNRYVYMPEQSEEIEPTIVACAGEGNADCVSQRFQLKSAPKRLVIEGRRSYPVVPLLQDYPVEFTLQNISDTTLNLALDYYWNPHYFKLTSSGGNTCPAVDPWNGIPTSFALMPGHNCQLRFIFNSGYRYSDISREKKSCSSTYNLRFGLRLNGWGELVERSVRLHTAT